MLITPPTPGRDRGKLRLKLLLTLLAVSICVAAIPVAPAKAMTISMPYDGPAVLAHSTIAQECEGRRLASTGVVCLTLPARASQLALSIDDKSGLSVGGSYYVYDAAGALTAMGTYCDTPKHAGPEIAVPGGATVVVRVELVNGPRACAMQGVVGGEPTRGLVTFNAW